MDYFKKGNELYFAKLRESAIIPTKREEDAGYDIYANFEDDVLVIEPHSTYSVPTGICTAFSKEYYIQAEERGSTGKIGLKRSAGVFDSGYRGEYFILLSNINDKPVVISKVDKEEMPAKFIVNGKRYKTRDCIIYPYKKAIAQLIVLPVPVMQTKEIDATELKNIPSERGEGGFGSSKK